MSLIRKSATRPPAFSSFFDNIFPGDVNDWALTPTKHSTFSVPAVNIREKGKKFEIEVAAPGLTKEDIKVSLDHDILTISAEKEQTHEDKDEKKGFSRREFNYQSFQRSFTLPENAELEKIAANYKDGILKISIPKNGEVENKKGRQIDIE